jgi:hypothetical protein
MQPHHVAHARGGGWRCVRKDLLHNPAGNAALLRDLRPLQSIVIVVPRLHLRCCKEVEENYIVPTIINRLPPRHIDDSSVILCLNGSRPGSMGLPSHGTGAAVVVPPGGDSFEGSKSLPCSIVLVSPVVPAGFDT